jgi:hypothetical protein
MTDLEPGLDLDALLDPARLAAAWQLAHARPAAVSDELVAEADEATEAGEPAREAALPVALAHQQVLDEIEHTLAAMPAIADKARRALAVPLAQLAQAIAPLDLAAAEAALDQLEDVWQTLLSEAGWPRISERGTD